MLAAAGMSRLFRSAAGLVVAALLALASAATAIDYVGKAEIMSALKINKRTNHVGREYLYLRLNRPNPYQTEWMQIAEGKKLAEQYKVRTGDTIRVRYSNATTSRKRGAARGRSDKMAAAARNGDPSADGLKLEGIDVLSAGTNGHEVYTGEKIRIKSMIYIIKTCGWEPATTVKNMRNLYFDGLPGTKGDYNINGYFDTCSYGKVSYDPSDNHVFGPVEVPCSDGSTYNSSANCGVWEMSAIRDHAEAAAREAGYGDFMDSTPLRRKVFVLPMKMKCPFAGIATMGCLGGFCSVFIRGSLGPDDLTIHMHELLHTLGLEHAMEGSNEYGDRTDVMGTAKYPSSYLCPSVANQNRLGWNKLIATVYPNNTNDASNTGVWGRWELPAAAASETNALYLQYDAPERGVRFPDLYVGFRSRTATYDSGLMVSMDNKVFIHVCNGTHNDGYRKVTRLMAMLGKGAEWTSPFVYAHNDPNVGGGFKLRVLDITPGASGTVQLCRFTEKIETLCGDGIDNDCNGLTDENDPNCDGIPEPPPSPRPSPPSPRPSPPPSPPPRPPPPPPPKKKNQG